jgi:hypothetical protein
MSLLRGAIVAIGLATGLGASAAQSPGAGGDTLIDVLVWGPLSSVDVTVYAPDVRAALERLLRRAQSYRSPRPVPKGSREEPMIYEAQVRYQRLLVAFADDPKARAAAVSYVDRLKPCYEWEGFHDCPEREALFAIEYLNANPSGPFNEFLPLLAAHRWVCAAEAYDHEKRPADAARGRRAYESALATARLSTDVLVRAAAAALGARGRCRAGS